MVAIPPADFGRPAIPDGPTHPRSAGPHFLAPNGWAVPTFLPRFSVLLSVSPRLVALLLALPITFAVVRGVRNADEYRTHSRDIDTATAANAESDVELGHLTDRIVTKLAIAGEYAAGRITLRTAAQRFLVLSGDEKSLANLRRLAPTAADDEERCAASVVRFLANSADATPGFAAAHRRAVAELHREYGDSATSRDAP